MAPPPQARVLRCCRCRLFQAHQMKKSLKWTCKACGEKQSFLRAYGEGSGADCRRHVQKLNLLQGQLSEASPRSLEEPVNADKENAGPGQAEHVGPQDHAGPAGKVREGSRREDWDAGQLTGPWGEPLCPAQRVRATSKWERFLLPLGSSHVDTGPPTPLQRDPRPAGAAQAEQGSPRAQTTKDGGLRTPSPLQLPWATHTPTSGPRRPFGETPEQWGAGPQAEGGHLVKGAQEPRPVRLCDLFNTGEDFDDVL
ncbi:MRN complex-interacting protein isoform X1 [Myotis myotis]|uniref:MRN complex interacting protein n=1 Tax=Myotis myotis TaxID=51298 RepID=A0A7J7XIE7_MYOMY|nr:MRN complex-interacting protein isoform X1 [Myotis myotis]KAF6349424.1 MRN complex interacting protein [Myotis myotis]